MKPIYGILLTAGLLLAGPASADDISYTYVEGDFLHIDADGLDSEQGIGLQGSLSLGDHFYLTADYAQADIDLASLDVDIESLDLGLGFHLGLGDLVHGLVEVAYASTEAGNADEDGYSVNVGLRFAATENIELGAKLGYADLGDNIDGGFGRFNLLYKFGRIWGVNFLADLEDDVKIYGVGLRASF